jgi:hypothetical protein
LCVKCVSRATSISSPIASIDITKYIELITNNINKTTTNSMRTKSNGHDFELYCCAICFNLIIIKKFHN